jgi:8-demethyl-8-alpha-L-rhamnosyltetracenomycin-C 2'-O-methyltransferase
MNCHNYIPGYTYLFDPIRMSVKTLLEIGIGSVENGQMGGITHTNYRTGNSLRCWRDYFPNASIHGIDIYPHTLNEPRITTYVADQSNRYELSKVIDSIHEPLDIIIDDGSHDGKHQVISFMYLEKYLSPSGIYVIEDVQPETIPGMQDLSAFPEDFRDYIREKYDVKIFDTREIAKKPDDFMISFKKKV